MTRLSGVTLCACASRFERFDTFADYGGPEPVGRGSRIAPSSWTRRHPRGGDAGRHDRSRAAVAASAVVTKDVAPYAIVAGVPARPIGQRFDDATVERLLGLAWWDWPRSDLERHVALFQGPVGNATLDQLESVGAGVAAR